MRFGKGRVVGLILLAGLVMPSVWGQDGAEGGQGRGGSGLENAQRVMGTVTATAPNQLTVKTEKGETFQIVTTTNTRLMKDRQSAQFGSIHSGDSVGAMGILDDSTKTLHAAMVMVVDAEQVKKAREGMGKVYIVGKVTAIDDVKITVLRPDGVSQVIEVDEGTSFKRGGRGMGGMGGFGGMGGMGGGQAGGRNGNGASPRAGAPAGGGGESITLADVKVGDSVGGPGVVKNGVFVPTELGVAVPGAGRQRRRGLDGSAPGAGAPVGDAGGAGSVADPK
jgi:hypothetical protein